jgi:hypothetical protein
MLEPWLWTQGEGRVPRMMLVDADGQTVLCAASGKLLARDPDFGILAPLRSTMPVAQLIEAAPGHALFAAAIVAGVARWEPWPPHDGRRRGELCIGGIRHALSLDAFGVPIMHAGLFDIVSDELARARTGEAAHG